MQRVIIILVLSLTIISCAVTSNTVDNTGNIIDRAKSKSISLFEKPGAKATLISTTTMQYKSHPLGVGEKKDLINRRAESYGFIDTPELSRYLQKIRKNLVKASGVTGVPGNVYIAANMDVGAEATLDGNIFINWGILKYMQNEDEVAAIMAHELAHVLLTHHNANLVSHVQRKSQWFQQTGIVASAAIRRSRNSTTNSSVNISVKDLKKGEITQLQNVQILVNLTSKVIEPSWIRTQESEADLLGTDLLIKAGYNPDGMLNMLSVVEQSTRQNFNNTNVKELLTHAFELAYNDNKMAKANAIVESLASFWGNAHADTEQRILDVSDYLANHYDEANTTAAFKEKEWHSLTKSKNTRRIVESYDGAFAAQKLLDSNDIEGAYKISKSTYIGSQKDAYPAFIYANTLVAKNKNKEADPILKATFDSKEPSGQVYRYAASRYEFNGRYKDALKVTYAAYEKLDKSHTFLPLMVRYQRLNGNLVEANNLASSCALNHTEYKDACYAELEKN